MAQSTNPSTAFYRKFADLAQDVQVKFDRIGDAAVPAAEKTSLISACLVEIVALQDEVKDASSYIPSYDQQSYSDRIKTLISTLDTLKAQHDPKPRFSFKKKTTVQSRIAAGPKTAIPADRTPARAGPESKVITSDHPAVVRLPSNLLPPFPSFVLEQVSDCLVDLTVSLTDKASEVPSIVVKNITRSVIVLPTITGPVHLTGLKNCMVGIRSCAQFRMHDCERVRVYMCCWSKPIVERVQDIGFAPFPPALLRSDDGESTAEAEKTNLYDQVQDFQWLKPTQSPYWHVISLAEQARCIDDSWSLVSRSGSTKDEDIQPVLYTALTAAGALAE